MGGGGGGQGINDADRPTPAPRKQAGGREGGEGAGLQPQNPSQASRAQALARQFCKSTTLLAKIPAMSLGDTEVRPSEGGVPEVFEEWFGPARVPLLTLVHRRLRWEELPIWGPANLILSPVSDFTVRPWVSYSPTLSRSLGKCPKAHGKLSAQRLAHGWCSVYGNSLCCSPKLQPPFSQWISEAADKIKPDLGPHP